MKNKTNIFYNEQNSEEYICKPYMEASEPKWVNSGEIWYGVNSLMLRIQPRKNEYLYYF